MLTNNEFGNLVKAYRKQRGWTQEELAERWGHTRVYVSQIEGGQRKLDSAAQVVRLADILDIPSEKLEAIGRGIPQRKINVQTASQADSAILQMLLAPGRDMVRLSWIAWYADSAPYIEENLRHLLTNLDQALTIYRGEFVKPAQQLLAYAHQMQGKMALERLDFVAASGHFSEMIDLGQELNDPDITTMGMVYCGSILRKRGRFETALRCFEAAKPLSTAISSHIQGAYYINLSTVYADAGREQPFLQAIDSALEIATNGQDSIASVANEFSLDDVLWAQAGGFAELNKPKEALKVYKETDRLHPFRPLRELGAYTIDKGEAYLRLGDLDKGLKLSLKGLQLASEYQSKRQIGWIEKTYNRLRVTPLGEDKRLITLREALVDVRRKQADW